MTLALSGFGTALPPHRFTQAELAELHGTFCKIDERRHRTLRALYRRSGVSTRRSVVLDASDGPLSERQSFFRPARDEHDRGPATAERMAVYEREARALALPAAREALRRGQVPADEVTDLVTVSCTGFVAPGVDSALIERLGLPPTTERTHVGFMGCHGTLNALRVAHARTESAPDRVALVCSVELCTLHFAYGWDPDMLVANALFSDGAAAVVGRGRAADGDWKVAGSGTLLMPDSADAMTWRVGDHGFRMTLSARVPDLIETHLGGWLRAWLGGYGLGLQDVSSWAVHPGGPRILTAVEEALGLDAEQTRASREVLSECGNMSSGTSLFILDRLRRGGASPPCVALAFGPGLVVEALLLH